LVKVRISRHIYRDCETHELGAWAHKDLKIPFAPYPGLIVHDGKGDVFEIKVIKYDCSDKITTCLVDYEHHTDYAYAKQCASAFGWQLREIRAGEICKDIRRLF
jgi:hypothetical protein